MNDARTTLWQDETLMTDDARRYDSGSEQREAAGGAFVTLYRRYVKRIYAYCFRRVGNHADAEDLTEQVFAEALEKFGDYEERGKAGAWLFSIAHSRVVDYYRRQRQDVALDETVGHSADGPTPERQLIDAERRQRLFAVLDRLDEGKRELILLRFGAELSYQEIGAIVGKREAAVKMAVYRLLDELRSAWYLDAHVDANAEDDHE